MAERDPKKNPEAAAIRVFVIILFCLNVVVAAAIAVAVEVEVVLEDVTQTNEDAKDEAGAARAQSEPTVKQDGSQHKISFQKLLIPYTFESLIAMFFI